MPPLWLTLVLILLLAVGAGWLGEREDAWPLRTWTMYRNTRINPLPTHAVRWGVRWRTPEGTDRFVAADRLLPLVYVKQSEALLHRADEVARWTSPEGKPAPDRVTPPALGALLALRGEGPAADVRIVRDDWTLRPDPDRLLHFEHPGRERTSPVLEVVPGHLSGDPR